MHDRLVASPGSNTAASSAWSTPDQPWSRPAEDVAAALDVDPKQGLSDAAVRQRRSDVGPNVLREQESRPWWAILAEQFKSLIIGLLVAAAVVAFVFGDTLEAWSIVAVIAINTAIGFGTEWSAVRSMESLRSLGQMNAQVRRGGEVVVISAEDLVPGDIVALDGGDVVTADVRILEASRLQADEASLTGESVPVDKDVGSVSDDAALADRTSMLYKGTAITRGTATGVVVRTGMDTELGDVSELVATAESEATPLEQRLADLGRALIGVTLLVIAAVTASGVVTGKDWVLMVETGIALAVAAIPEGLPIVATIALARGMRRMARKNALIRSLPSVETLGATRVICTDKTGTLTESQMTVTAYWVPDADAPIDVDERTLQQNERTIALDDEPCLQRAVAVGALCTNANHDPNGTSTGDPMEIALLRVAENLDTSREDMEANRPRVREEAFDADVKMMATVHDANDGYHVAVKGAPEAVLDASTSRCTGDGSVPFSDDERTEWRRRNEEMAGDGLRVLGLAEKTVADPEAPPYEDLTFLGLVGLHDPPRDDVHPAIEACQSAGINVVMVTGDQPATARGVGLSIGLVDDPEAPVLQGGSLPSLDDLSDDERHKWLHTHLFARVTPRQKLDLIQLHQDAGHIVAMTGDGVNDAPALKKADIGIAMGQRGTQVAQEAADMVLSDDAFSTIVTAVEQGRIIFRNIQRFVYYLMSCNVGEVVVVGLATLLGTTLPILPLQILFLNLVTDVFPALALGVGEGSETTMDRPPRDSDQPIISRRQWMGIGAYGFVFAGAVLGALLWALEGMQLPTDQAVTVSFLTLALAQLFHVFNMRDPEAGVFRNEVTRNPWIWGAIALCMVLLAVAVWVPPLAHVLDIHPLPAEAWSVVGLMSLVPFVVGQGVLAMRRG